MSAARMIFGDCLAVLPTLEAGSVDAVTTDPPYGLEFMGKEWDCLAGDWNSHKGETIRSPGRKAAKFKTATPRYHAGESAQAWHQQWAAAALRVLKPGGYMLAFGGTRTYHRLACAVEDAGFEIRDCLMWLYGTGFPKGRGCLKPAWEPILLCRKPGPKVLPLGIEECRVPASEFARPPAFDSRKNGVSRENYRMPNGGSGNGATSPLGRYPANVVHDGSDEVQEAFAAFGERHSAGRYVRGTEVTNAIYGKGAGKKTAGSVPTDYGDTGSAARFYYTAKASKAERGEGNTHPTVKPLALMEWLVKLVCPPGGTVLDPFAGSGTTGVACLKTGRGFIGVEKDPAYFAIAEKRLAEARAAHPLFAGGQP